MVDETNNQQNESQQNESQQNEKPVNPHEFTPEQQKAVDRLVQNAKSKERSLYGDYEDLRNKVSEFEKHKEQLTQQELEKKQEYEKLKEGWGKERETLSGKISELNGQINNEKITNALTTQVLNQNAYPDAVQLVKDMAKINEDGTITIRGKDANGIDTELPVDKGVEQFLKERPYLVKGNGTGGGNTGNAGNTGGNQGGGASLADQLQNAMAVGDRAKVNEIKSQIRAKHNGNAIVST